MKNTILALFLIGLPLIGMSQTPVIKSFYDKYKNMDKVQDVQLQGWLLELASTFTDEESAGNLLKKITQLRVLIMDEGNLVSQQEYKSLLKEVKKSQFEELIQIKDGDQKIEFLIREKGETITDVLVVINGPDDFVMLSLEGKLKFSDLNDLNIEIEGAEHFQKLPEAKKDLPRA